MPIPFDMLAVMLFLGYYAETPVANPPPALRAVILAVSACLLLFAASFCIAHLALRALRRRFRPAPERRRLAAGADAGLRIVLAGTYVALLDGSALPWSLAAALGLASGPEAFSVLALGILPYICLFFVAWLPMYRLHRETNPGSWTRLSFLIHKARYNLYMLLAWLPFAFLADLLGRYLMFLPLLFLLAAWSFPLLLAKAWGCRALPEGEVLDAVRRLEAAAGARFSRVYLWEPGGGGTQNAAAVGIFRPFRYLFLTPAIIRNMSGPELEAVILHELGHVRKRHLLFYLFTSLAGINAAVLAGALFPAGSDMERFFVTAALVLCYFRLVFGWLSRNMERQADLFALEKSGSSRGLANALEKLGLSAGNIRLAASWHHLGIAQRVDFLRRAEREPALIRRHNAGVSRIMAGGYLLSLLVIVLMGWLVHVQYSLAVPPLRTGGEQAHWRRVMLLMPDNAAAPLELAYRLAAHPGDRDEAGELAGEAMRLARGGEIEAAAAKLLRELADDGMDL